MTRGDLVLVPHGGERFGRMLAMVVGVSGGGTVTVRRWRPSLAAWDGGASLVAFADCSPVAAGHTKVKAMLRAVEKRALRSRAS